MDTTRLILETHSAMQVIQERTERLDRAVCGNGRPGLLDRVGLLEERQETCPARENVSFAVRHARAMWAVALCSLLVSACVMALMFKQQLLPLP